MRIMYSIGMLSRETGIKVPTIRYYEQVGLLPEPARSAGNQRRYDRAARDRLAFIRHARDLGFPLGDIRELLDLAGHPDQPCTAADQIAARQLRTIKARIRRLTLLRDELTRMLRDCAAGQIADCRVIEVLGNHDLCRHPHPPSPGQPPTG